jgi:hypothetical protein
MRRGISTTLLVVAAVVSVFNQSERPTRVGAVGASNPTPA